MNHNQILGVGSDASKSEIQSAFRKAAMEVHPDHSNSAEAAEAFQRIKEARDELMKRAETEQARPKETVQASTAAAVRATTQAAYMKSTITSMYDDMTPEEIAHIQMLDELVYGKPKRTWYGRIKESAEARAHRRKLKTNDRRLNGKY